MAETRLWHLFGMCGKLRRVIFGINRITRTPCEFAFIEYESAESANAALKFFRGIEIEGRPLAVDKDIGFQDGRQYGRGVFGGKLKTDNARKRRALNSASRYYR